MKWNKTKKSAKMQKYLMFLEVHVNELQNQECELKLMGLWKKDFSNTLNGLKINRVIYEIIELELPRKAVVFWIK